MNEWMDVLTTEQKKIVPRGERQTKENKNKIKEQKFEQNNLSFNTKG